MPHDQCPPNRRGHSWRELTFTDLSRHALAARTALVFRVCKRCNALGRVSTQGVVHVVEGP